MKFYLAYGSNLSVEAMAKRCPDAIYVGTAEIKDYRLLFKTGGSGTYLTVEPKEGESVPVLVWCISEEDERSLDYYEAYPNLYYKTTMEVEIRSFLEETKETLAEALIYIMYEESPLGTPKQEYYEVCLEGYKRFGFDETVLERALKLSSTK